MNHNVCIQVGKSWYTVTRWLHFGTLLLHTVARNYRNQENGFPFAGILGISQKQLQWGWEDPKSDRGGIYKQGWWRLQYLWGIVRYGEGGGPWWGFYISITFDESHSNQCF